MTESDLRDLIRNRRLALELTFIELSQRTGVNAETIGHWERGENLERFAQFLSVIEHLGFELRLSPKLLSAGFRR